MRHHDQFSNPASYWINVACVSIRSGSFPARLVCLIRASSGWMSRVSPYRRLSLSCLSYVRRLPRVCLLAVGWASPSWLSRERHRAGCHSCFAMLEVTRAIRLAIGLPGLVRVARLTRYINGSMPSASILCKIPYCRACA